MICDSRLLQCSACNGANTENNLTPLLRVLQEEIEYHQESSRQSKGKKKKTNATGTDSDNPSEEQDCLSPDPTRTPLLEDSHQHGLMLAAYREVGHDYAVKNSQLVKGCEVL